MQAEQYRKREKEMEEKEGSSLVKFFSECQIGERKIERMEEGGRDKMKKKKKKEKEKKRKNEREKKRKSCMILFFSRII